MAAVYLVRFFSFLGLSIILPFYSLWLHQLNIFSIVEIATLTGTLIFSGRFLGFVLSPFMGVFHKKHILASSQLIAAVCSLLIFVLSLEKTTLFSLWFLATFFWGSTFSITTLSLLTLVSQCPEKSYFKGFAYINIALNLSAGLGALIGGIILHYYPFYFVLVPSSFLFITFFICFILPLDSNRAVQSIILRLNKLYKIPGKNEVLLLSLNMLIFIAYAQFYEVFPFMAKEFISPTSVGILFLICSITIVLVQLIINNMVRQKPYLFLILAHLLFFIGLLLLPAVVSKNYFIIIIGVILISIAEVIFVPIYRALCVKWNEDEQPDLALARLGITWGTSNSLAAAVGLYWVGNYYFFHPYVLGITALLVAIFLLWFNKKKFFRLTL